MVVGVMAAVAVVMAAVTAAAACDAGGAHDLVMYVAHDLVMYVAHAFGDHHGDHNHDAAHGFDCDDHHTAHPRM